MRRLFRLAPFAWAAFAFAAAVDAQQSALQRSLRACAGIAKDAERLACYDTAVKALDTEGEPITARVKAVRQIGHDALLIELDNGQVWRQARLDVVLGLEPGDEVTISRAALGSYRLRTKTDRYTRVTRVR
jgi:hypothetical protein